MTSSFKWVCDENKEESFMDEQERLLKKNFYELKKLAKGEVPSALQTRLKSLKNLRKALLSRREEFADAVHDDFEGRSKHETYFADVFTTSETLLHCERNLKNWMQPQSRRVNLPFMPAKAEVIYQPKGIVGILSPWNYPIQLALAPLVAAISAGNRVMLKPSEFTPRTSLLLQDVLHHVFDEDMVRVVQGGSEIGAAFSSLPFDHLFYTGSTSVGRKIMKAAAENLTPVTLELGGKSPALIHRNVDHRMAARRIVAGKWLNAGQTCIAPDYVLVHRTRAQALVREVKEELQRCYPSLLNNPDYSSVVNVHHRERLWQLLDDAAEKGAQMIDVNSSNEKFTRESSKIKPHILLDVKDEMKIMQDEIFGPLLPVVLYDALDEAVAYVNDRPHPLAFYYFDDDKKRVQSVLERTRSGGVCINETVLHFAQDNLPFGGVGASGMGNYHGYEGFLTFSHARSVFRQNKFSVTRRLTPPYDAAFEKILDFFLR